MIEFKAIKAVYSYYFPEIRGLISDVVKKYPHDVFLRSVTPGLDDFHKPVIEKYVNFYTDDVYGLSDYGFSYFTSGASEGLFHLLSMIKTKYSKLPVYTFDGEYEGYREYAKGIGIKVSEVPADSEYIKSLPKGIWFISNPSARNGNIIDNGFIRNLCDSGHKVIYDLTYLGLTERYTFDVSHKNILAVVTSMSKPFGLYYYRVGFTFAREEISTLYGNKWFKNIFSLLIADRVLDTFSPDYLVKKYLKRKELIVESINKELGLGLKSSDALLLAHITERDGLKLDEGKRKLIDRFKRGSNYRFCLTKYFLDAIG